MNGFGGAIFAQGGSTTFQSCTFISNRARVVAGHPTAAIGGAVYLTGSASADFAQTTFVGNWADSQGGAVLLVEDAEASFDACIIAYTESEGGLVIDSTSASASLSCCDVYGNAGGDYVGLPDQTGASGNISVDPLFCDLDADDLHLAATSSCLPANNSCGVQIGAFPQGCNLPTAAPSSSYPLLGVANAFPNPFNPSTEISFYLSAAARVSLRIFDISGRLARNLLDGVDQEAGEVRVSWDGRDDTGQTLPSGVYFYEVETGEYRVTRKMTLLK